MENFNEQYKDPRWEKKRLEIYRRDLWQCRKCNATNIKLNAHHLYYERGLNIWEYDNDALVTLCDKCHFQIHTDLKKIAGIVAFKIFTGEIDILDIYPLADFSNIFLEDANNRKF